jgi:hypothetical protein
VEAAFGGVQAGGAPGGLRDSPAGKKVQSAGGGLEVVVHQAAVLKLLSETDAETPGKVPVAGAASTQALPRAVGTEAGRGRDGGAGDDGEVLDDARDAFPR